jgi:hypothetical protein
MLTLMALWILLSTFSKTSSLAIPAVMAAPAPRPTLTATERSSLRYHLQNLWSEMDLLVRNQETDEKDLRRQDREFALFRVFDRIPFEPRIPELKKELSTSAQKYGLEISLLQIQRNLKEPPAPPKEIYTDKRPFHFSKEQLYETLRLKISGRGSIKDVQRWLDSWDDILLRYVEPLGPITRTPRGWQVQAAAYRFRNVNFPRLKPRDPVTLLPAWARKDPGAFAQAEPQLWNYVTRIRAKTSEAELPYENRRKFLLNAARMSFFLSKALPHEEATRGK